MKPKFIPSKDKDRGENLLDRLEREKQEREFIHEFVKRERKKNSRYPFFYC